MDHPQITLAADATRSATTIAPQLRADDLAVVLELADERLTSLAAPAQHVDRRALERVRDAASDAWLAL